MLKSMMNDDEAFSTVIVLIFQKLCCLHVVLHAARSSMAGVGIINLGFGDTQQPTTFLHVCLTSEHTRHIC